MLDYAKFGVPFYCVIDPQARVLEIFVLDARGKYVHEIGAASGKVAGIPGFEGLVLDLDELWTKLDELEGEG